MSMQLDKKWGHHLIRSRFIPISNDHPLNIFVSSLNSLKVRLFRFGGILACKKAWNMKFWDKGKTIKQKSVGDETLEHLGPHRSRHWAVRDREKNSRGLLYFHFHIAAVIWFVLQRKRASALCRECFEDWLDAGWFGLFNPANDPPRSR